MVETVIAIPSHRRMDIFLEKTHSFLVKSKCPYRVDVFLSDAEDLKDYSTYPHHHNLIVTHAKNVVEKFNYIHNYYPEGTKVFVMEDDIELISKDGKLVSDLKEVVETGFKQIPQGGIFGIAPHSNTFYMQNKITDTLKLVVAHAFGFVSTRDKFLEVTQLGKSDYERTCRYFIEYGRTVRLDYIGVKTNSYTQAGGMQSDLGREERAAAESESVDFILKHFPDLIEENTKKKSLFREMKFKRRKFQYIELRMMKNAIKRKLGI